MDKLSGFFIRHAARVIAASMLCVGALAQTQVPSAMPADERLDLAQALQAAWSRSLDAAQASGRQQRARAEQDAADSWLAGAPALDISQREGRSAAGAGSRETELGVALPIWYPGLRDASRRAAQSGLDGAQAAEQTARLRLAGELREVAAAVRAAEADLRLAELEQQLYAQLVDDVQRRVRAGDLAPADALAVRSELLEAQARLYDSRQRQQVQRARWQLLTGWARVAEPEPAWMSGEPDLETHPLMRLARLEREHSRLGVERVQAESAAVPELRLGMRQEQSAQDQGTGQSVVIGVRLPLGAASYRQPQLAAALAVQELADAQEQRTLRQLQSDLELARAGVQAAASQANAARERAELLRQRAGLIERSFTAGQSPLPELLRALASAAQAEAAVVRQQAALELAQSRLRQSLGILP